MTPIQQALQTVGGILNPQPKLISPIPEYDTLTDPGLLNYLQVNQANEDYAAKNPPVNYPPAPTVQPLSQKFVPNNPQPVQTNQPNPVEQAINILNPNKSQTAQAQEVKYSPQDASTYERQAADIFDKQGIPPSVGLGIWAMEGRGKTINPNNPYNLGAYDSNPQNANAYGFKDPIQGTEEAAKFLAGQSQYMDNNKKKIFQQALQMYKKTGNQEQYLKAIAPTYSSNPDYANTVMQTPEFQRWTKN